MANGNVELWIQVAAIIVGLAGAVTAAFGGAYLGAKRSHDLEVQRREKEEKEKVNDFKERILRKLKHNAYVLAEREIEKYRTQTENLIESLEFGNASTFYYRIPKEEREEIDPVLDLLFYGKYDEAKDKLESLVNQQDTTTSRTL